MYLYQYVVLVSVVTSLYGSPNNLMIPGISNELSHETARVAGSKYFLVKGTHKY